jgi:hypothetical protein
MFLIQKKEVENELKTLVIKWNLNLNITTINLEKDLKEIL